MKTCKKVCSECPFLNNSLRGWLGPHLPDEILNAMQFETPFSCHKQRTDSTNYADLKMGTIDVCRGFLISAKKSSKMFGQSPQGKALRRLQDSVQDQENILSRIEFKAYHDIAQVNQIYIRNIIEAPHKYNGRYYGYDSKADVWIACDNRSANANVEEFSTEYECLEWLSE